LEEDYFVFCKNQIYQISLGTWVLGFSGATKGLVSGLHGYALAVAIVLLVVGTMYIGFYFLVQFIL